MLRDYQATAVERTLAAIASKGSAVLQMPTGAGKTKTATEIIKRHDKPVLFICHRQEIERQASKAFTAAGIEHGIVSPRAKPDYDKPVQIASVATLARRIKDMPLPSLVIWDECHHTPAKSWARIREALAGSQHLGLTATPERLDGKGLSDWFDELVVGPSTRELIDSGWLSDFRYFAPSEPDLKGARLQAGDYAKNDLAKVMNTPVLIGDAIAEYQKNAAGKRALVFCASVDASQELVRRFKGAGVPALHVDGNTPTPERDAAVDALATGEIKVLSNVEVFTEGFDLPAIDAVILLRPTKSLALFLQMIGRALRKAEGKNEALIFDHAGLWLDHDWFDLPIEWSLDGGARERRLAGRKIGPRRCPECHEVRPARVEVCACGYEFPMGREIGEYDGVLRELRGVVPEGWETQEAFRRRVGGSWCRIENWKKSGIPHDGTLIHVAPALDWLESTNRMIPEGFETIRSFASRHNVSWGAVRKWLDRGLPHRGKYIDSVNGDTWVRGNHDNQRMSSPPEGFERQIDFQKRYGLTGGSARTLARIGLPMVGKFVKIPEADVWFQDHVEKSRHAGQRIYGINDNSMSKPEFSRKYRVTCQYLGSAERSGAPFLKNGRIIEDDFLAWVSIKGNASSGLRPFWLVDSANYVSFKGFTRIVGVGYDLALKRGWKHKLPCASNGWVHIQRGLEWVRDNTSITIPPEAWPADNDNQASQPRAAQAA